MAYDSQKIDALIQRAFEGNRAVSAA